MDEQSRRSFLQQVAAGATGLCAAFTQWRIVCGAEVSQTNPPPWLAKVTATDEWKRLDGLWDELTQLAAKGGWRGKRTENWHKEVRAGAKQLEAMKQSLGDALNAVSRRMAALGASADSADALRRLCMHRRYHIWRSRYTMATCYKPSFVGHASARSCDAIEKQCAALQSLTKDGKLTPDAATKAAQLIARQAELIVEADELFDKTDHTQAREGRIALTERIDRQTWGLKADLPVSARARDCALAVVQLSTERRSTGGR